MPNPIPTPLQNWLDAFNALKQKLLESGFKITPSNAREALETLTRRYVTSAPEIPLVQDDMVPGNRYSVPVRIYHPQPEEALPLLLLAHGGGHMAGSLSLYDPIARRLAKAASHVVVSVDYRLAPECPYPLGVTDLGSVIKGIQPVLRNLGLRFEKRISLAGDSAGGALCATSSHRFQFDPGVSIHRQVLIYPSLDYTLSQPSAGEYAKGYLLDRDRIFWYFDNYFQGIENRKDASPLFMPCSNRLPETLVITAEYCPLRDEGKAYADRLRDAGIRAEYLQFDGMIHAFLNLEELVKEQCAEAYLKIGQFLNS
ncbi:MAG: alpha/beta hydrolase [Gammaproteobacteria bacterium]|nr:alpha/beta hydrolase [Gammaproteobacteria bacterium]MCB1881082.1 alpha/beta hydrolase [Gammaproteobacteria bacterium]MCB1905185.1 alpha/beta hydrolase [Gammaproteobacteria bacterium]